MPSDPKLPPLPLLSHRRLMPGKICPSGRTRSGLSSRLPALAIRFAPVHAVRRQVASAPLQSSCPVSGKMRPTLTNARRASATAAVSCGSEEAGTGTGAEAGDGTGADVSIGGVRAGTGAAGATPAVSLRSEEADTGAGAEAGGGTMAQRDDQELMPRADQERAQ
jgi:hypothetical protein